MLANEGMCQNSTHHQETNSFNQQMMLRIIWLCRCTCMFGSQCPVQNLTWTFVLNVLKSLGSSMTHSISKHRVNVKNQFLWVCFSWKSLYSTPALGYLKLLLLLNSGHGFLVFSLSQYSTNLIKLTLISLHYCSYLPCIGCHALQFGSGIHCWTVNSMLYYCFLESHREDCQVTSIAWRFLRYKEKQTHQNPKHVLFG